MFYLFSILGVNEGENTVLRTEKKKIPSLARGRDFGDRRWKRCLSLTWRHDQPHTGPIGRESYDPSSLATSEFVYHQTLDHGEMGKRAGDWFESRQ